MAAVFVESALKIRSIGDERSDEIIFTLFVEIVVESTNLLFLRRRKIEGRTGLLDDRMENVDR